MRTLLIAAVVAVAPVWIGCSHTESHTDAAEGFNLIHVSDLQKMQQSGNTAVYDANDAEFRAKNGIIPGAKLLSSYNAYDVGQELPANKGAPLVFYCANTH
jgi:hypothetical protein